MRKLIRILAGVAVLGAIAFVPSPASASHGPAPTAPHEDIPVINIVNPLTVTDACVVTGGVDAGTSFSNTAHGTIGGVVPLIPVLTQDPSHSHFAFNEAVISCLLLAAGGLDVEATGGNDGHILDVGAGPLVGGDGPPHDHNGHHGSTIESAWSHSSDYDGDAADDCATGSNTNKADIEIGGTHGWVKYVRVAAVVHAWGCVDLNDATSPLDGAGDYFSADLAISPQPVPLVDVPLFPDSPLACFLEPLNFITNANLQPCAFLLVGPAIRGTALLPLV
jgi:hypothetical protein